MLRSDNTHTSLTSHFVDREVTKPATSNQSVGDDPRVRHDSVLFLNASSLDHIRPDYHPSTHHSPTGYDPCGVCPGCPSSLFGLPPQSLSIFRCHPCQSQVQIASAEALVALKARVLTYGSAQRRLRCSKSDIFPCCLCDLRAMIHVHNTL